MSGRPCRGAGNIGTLGSPLGLKGSASLRWKATIRSLPWHGERRDNQFFQDLLLRDHAYYANTRL